MNKTEQDLMTRDIVQDMVFDYKVPFKYVDEPRTGSTNLGRLEPRRIGCTFDEFAISIFHRVRFICGIPTRPFKASIPAWAPGRHAAALLLGSAAQAARSRCHDGVRVTLGRLRASEFCGVRLQFNGY